MATATERWSPRSSSRGADLRWSAVREFDVTLATGETEADVYLASISASDLPHSGTVPTFNNLHPLYPRLLVDNLSVARVGFGLYRLTVTYSIPLNGTAHDGDDDKLSSPMRIRWQRSTIEEEVDRDINGNPIVNSARDPFRTPARRKLTRIVLTLWRYEPFYDALKAQNFENTVNSGPIQLGGYIWPSRTVRCNIIAPMEEYKYGDTILPVGYELEMQKDGWRTRQLDAGFRVHIGEGEVAALYLSNGERISGDPALLNGHGAALNESLLAGSHLNPDDQVSYVDPPAGAELEEIVQPGEPIAKAVFLRYQLDPESNFADLGLS